MYATSVHQLREAIALQRNFVARWRGRFPQLNLVAKTTPENHRLALFLAHEQILSNWVNRKTWEDLACSLSALQHQTKRDSLILRIIPRSGSWTRNFWLAAFF